MSPFLFNFNFLNNTKIEKSISKTNKNLKKIFKLIFFKVVPAITNICTGGQQCKYQLLGSGVNISYYLHRGEFLLLF